jgi:CubicO group peptidase (beta-lactamase class C family)
MVMTRREFARVVGSSALFLRTARLRAAEREWRVTGHDVPELRSFDTTIERYMRTRSIRAGALAVTRNGQLVLAKGYSFDDTPDARVDPTSIFRIASLSKPITSAVVFRLVQEGNLDLAAPVTAMVPITPLPGLTRDPRFSEVTILRLLQHLGGWDRDRTFDPMFYDRPIQAALQTSLPIRQEHIVTFMAGQRIDYPPGSTHVYSNFGYLLLGRVIEAVTRMPYAAATKAAVLTPLRIGRMRPGRTLENGRATGEVRYDSMYSGPTVMDDSGRQVPSPYGGFNLENMDAHGGWLASAIDLARFAVTFDDPDRDGVLTRQSVERIFAPPPTGIQGGAYYGCGWAVRPVSNSTRNTWHNGSLPGTTSLMVRRWDGLNWAVLFGQRDSPDDPQSRTYFDIDGQLHVAADAVSRWPSHDFFPEYLAAVPLLRLLPGQDIGSKSGRYALTYRTDGKLALYDRQVGALWTSDTRGPAGQVVMQADGNLVISDARGMPEWASNTGGNPGAYAFVTDDGNLVIFSAADQVIWRCRP